MNKTIAFEIGTEELPALELHNATKQVIDKVCNQPGKLFDFEEVNVYSTPRRIIVVVNGVPETTEASTEEYKGPKVEIAFKDGNPTKAAIGFAKGKGLDVSELEQRDGYIYAVKHIPEKHIIDMLPNLFLDLITGIRWKKVQRWGDRPEEFARPIRWLVAMFGDDVVDVEYAGVKASNITYGHRFLCPGKKELANANQLIDVLQNNKVVLTEHEREVRIIEQVKRIEKETGLVAETPKAVLSEVINLCEYPTCMIGKFNELFLDVPKEIIVDAMLVHQRYFPLFDKAGKLTNNFIIVSNGDPKCETAIVNGNQRVVDARLYDAKFFFDEDKKKELTFFVDKLNDVVFQEKLGTMKAKAKRISKLSEFIAKKANLENKDIAFAKRAGLLAKADLVSSAVVEFTQVQGIMGSYYADNAGEDKDVSCAIREQYKPRFAGDSLPSTNVSRCVALADKIDTLCGMFAVNQAPTGSSDPFALRRGSIGIINIMKDGLKFELSDIVDFALNQYVEQGIEFDKDKVFNEVMSFIITRTKVLLKDSGIDHDSIEAVLAVNVIEPLDFINRANALDAARKEKLDLFTDLATAFSRANNLRDKNLGNQFDASMLNSSEKNLCEAIVKAKSNIKSSVLNKDYPLSLEELSKLREPIDKFFEDVMIMDNNEEVKNNRLRILNFFVEAFHDVADFSKIAKNK